MLYSSVRPSPRRRHFGRTGPCCGRETLRDSSVSGQTITEQWLAKKKPPSNQANSALRYTVRREHARTHKRHRLDRTKSSYYTLHGNGLGLYIIWTSVALLRRLKHGGRIKVLYFSIIVVIFLRHNIKSYSPRGVVHDHSFTTLRYFPALLYHHLLPRSNRYRHLRGNIRKTVTIEFRQSAFRTVFLHRRSRPSNYCRILNHNNFWITQI